MSRQRGEGRQQPRGFQWPWIPPSALGQAGWQDLLFLGPWRMAGTCHGWHRPTYNQLFQISILVTPASIQLCLVGRKTREHSTHDGNCLNRDGEVRVELSPEKNWHRIQQGQGWQQELNWTLTLPRSSKAAKTGRVGLNQSREDGRCFETLGGEYFGHM